MSLPSLNEMLSSFAWHHLSWEEEIVDMWRTFEARPKSTSVSKISFLWDSAGGPIFVLFFNQLLCFPRKSFNPSVFCMNNKKIFTNFVFELSTLSGANKERDKFYCKSRLFKKILEMQACMETTYADTRILILLLGCVFGTKNGWVGANKIWNLTFTLRCVWFRSARSWRSLGSSTGE